MNTFATVARPCFVEIVLDEFDPRVGWADAVANPIADAEYRAKRGVSMSSPREATEAEIQQSVDFHEQTFDYASCEHPCDKRAPCATPQYA